ncbi:unnamed protein product [Lactuca virosa]|uniref:Uncharacterized protein n=1 Tax=Lactuca virosa TaxID=75947 RepID=A0AAU9MKD0_9ASTR|nr:unnamed protein product [Lactuca virosa]
MLENHHLEFIKQTMLKHEDTFRHQVRELHRIYNVQKSLMGTLRNDIRRNTDCQRATLDTNSHDKRVGFDLSRSAMEDTSCGDSSGIHDDKTGPNDVELTLSIGPSASKRLSENRLHQTGGSDSKTKMKTNVLNSSTLYNEDKKRPHWLFQDLSLNRT